MQMIDTQAQSIGSRWSIAAVVFGVVCNVSVLVFETYQEYYAGVGGPHQLTDWGTGVFVIAISLAPSLALFAFRNLWPVVFVYASILFLILIWRVQYRYEDIFKFDTPLLVLLFLGMISLLVMILVWAVVRLGALVRKR
jgi:hypothetical protein